MTLDATVGGASANSYVTLAEAESYFKDRAHSDEWNELGYDVRGTFLITASQQLDWYANWKGDKTTYTQSMDWPRKDVLYPDGTDYPDDIIPPEIKRAVYELALSSINLDRSADQDLDGLAEVQAGPLRVKTDTSLRAKSLGVLPEKVRKIISDFTITGSMGFVRLMRA